MTDNPNFTHNQGPLTSDPNLTRRLDSVSGSTPISFDRTRAGLNMPSACGPDDELWISREPFRIYNALIEDIRPRSAAWETRGVEPRHRPTILVTGGTGSLGRALVDHLLDTTDAHVRVFSRDEHKQEAMARVRPPSERLTYILGDLRDERRVREAIMHCSHVVHAAALKTVPGGARHVSEFAAVNIQGTESVIRAAIDEGNVNALFISTDKAVDPLNAYGKTKAVAEELWIQANARGQAHGARFAAVRGGNVWMSAGSVGRVWADRITAGQPIDVYNANAITRFHMRMSWWVDFVRERLATMVAGTIYVPEVSAWSLAYLSEAVERRGIQINRLGHRSGDKFHEVMIAAHESGRAVKLTGGSYAIQPSSDLTSVWRYPSGDLSRYVEDVAPFGEGDSYASHNAYSVTKAEIDACAADVIALAQKQAT